MLFILAVIYIVFISLGLPDSLFGIAWPVVHNEFGVNEGFASVYSIITGICTGGVSFIAGKLLRKFGTANVTFFSIFLTALGLIGMSFAPNIVVMMMFSIILGYGAGAIDTGLNNYVSLHYSSRHMNWLHCFWGVGVTASPLIMSMFLGGEAGSWRNGYRVIAMIQLLIAGLVGISLKKWNSTEKDDKEGTEIEAATNKSFLEILKTKGVITGILSLGFYCCMEFLVGTWGATYLVNVFAIDPKSAAKWISLYYGGIMLGRFVSGLIAVKVGDNTLIRGGTVISLLGMIILLLPIGATASAGLLLIGFGFGPIFPSILNSIPTRFGREYSADITGYHMGGAYGIGFGAQLIYGFAASNTTFGITAFVLITFCVLLFITNEITIKRTLKKEK